MDKNELFNIGQKALAGQSFSGLLGAKLTVFQPGEAVLEIPVREHYRGAMASEKPEADR